MKSNLKPLIRFENYKEEWKDSVLSDLATFSKGSGYSKGDLVEAGHPILLYGQLYTNYKTIITSVNNYVNQKKKSVLSIGDEIVVPASGETSEEIARASAITIPNIIIGGDLNIIRPMEKINSIFLALSLSHGETHNDLKKLAQGKSVVHLHNSAIKKIRLKFPSVKEQIEIGLFFKGLDDLISLHHKELDALKKTKQGFLQKMFPNGEETLPTIRFNSFVEMWKQDEFGKVIKLVGGATPLKGNKEYWIGDIVWLSSQEIKNKYVSKGTYTISEKAVRDNRTKVVPLGTPLIVTRSGILAKRFPISISSNEVAINQDIKALIFDKTKIDTEFIVAQIKAKEAYILNNIVKTGTTVQSVNLPDLNRMILHIPEYEEQVKIGEFFRQLDEVVDLKEQELEALKETKKGFLQKMFV